MGPAKLRLADCVDRSAQLARALGALHPAHYDAGEPVSDASPPPALDLRHNVELTSAYFRGTRRCKMRSTTSCFAGQSSRSNSGQRLS